MCLGSGKIYLFVQAEWMDAWIFGILVVLKHKQDDELVGIVVGCYLRLLCFFVVVESHDLSLLASQLNLLVPCHKLLCDPVSLLVVVMVYWNFVFGLLEGCLA